MLADAHTDAGGPVSLGSEKDWRPIAAGESELQSIAADAHSLTLFADQHTDNVVLGYEFPSSWYQTVEPFFVVTFAPIFAWLWTALGRREPSSPSKFAWALMLLSIGFALVAYAALRFSQTGMKVSPLWLVGLYFFHAMGELLWIDGEAPLLAGAFPTYRRLTTALDTGGAIKGDVRADLYLGEGAAAGAEAGRVRHTLRLWRLVPR